MFCRHEDLTAGRWVGFGIVWIALATFTYEAVAYRRSQIREVVEAAAM